MFFNNSSSTHNELKRTHLSDPLLAINGCLCRTDDLDMELIERSDYIDYFTGDTSPHIRENEKECFSISRISDSDKYTDGLINCTSTILVGRCKESGKNISFLTHQDPNFFLDTSGWIKGTSKQQRFKRLLHDNIVEFMALCEEGTVDIVIAGGNDNLKNERHLQEYYESINLLNKIIFKASGLNASIIFGPSQGGNYNESKGLSLDTKNRRLFDVRNTSQLENAVSFTSDQVHSHIKPYDWRDPSQ